MAQPHLFRIQLRPRAADRNLEIRRAHQGMAERAVRYGGRSRREAQRHRRARLSKGLGRVANRVERILPGKRRAADRAVEVDDAAEAGSLSTASAVKRACYNRRSQQETA